MSGAPEDPMQDSEAIEPQKRQQNNEDFALEDILAQLRKNPALILKVQSVLDAEASQGVVQEDTTPDNGKRIGLRWMEFLRREQGIAQMRKRGRITVGYWKIRGLGAPLRMLLEYVGAVYTDKPYVEPDTWFQQDKPKLGKKNPLVNLPYIQDGDIVVCQTNACLQYLGDRFGLSGETSEARRLNVQMLCETYDLRNDAIELVYPHKERCRTRDEYKTKMTNHIKKSLQAYYEKLEKLYMKQGGPYLAGRQICTADFHVWELLDQHEAYAKSLCLPSPMEGYTKLQGFYAAFRHIPQLKPYFKSEKYTLECNGGQSWSWPNVQ